MRIIVLLGFCLSGVYSQSRLPNPAAKSSTPPTQTNGAAKESTATAPATPKPGSTSQAAAINTAVKPAPTKAAVAPRTPTPVEVRSDALLAAALSDKNPDIRKQAVAALGLVGPREPYLTQLAGALGDKDMLVRLTAVATLVDLKNRETLPWLHKALDDEAPFRVGRG